MQPEPIASVIDLLKRLPGLGPRSASRLVYALLGRKNPLLRPLIESLSQLRDSLVLCQRCFAIDTNSPCRICLDPHREPELLCVVETLNHLYTIERSGAFHGHYFVLHGVLSAIEGVTPEKLRLPQLKARLQSEPHLTEVILATSLTLDGATTAHVIAELVAELPHITLTRPARGLPIGSDLEYSDSDSVSAAFSARTEYS